MLRLTNRCHSLDRERYLVSSYVLGFATPLLYRVMGSHLSPIAKQLKLYREHRPASRVSHRQDVSRHHEFCGDFGINSQANAKASESPKVGFFIVNPYQKAPTHKYI